SLIPRRTVLGIPRYCHHSFPVPADGHSRDWAWLRSEWRALRLPGSRLPKLGLAVCVSCQDGFAVGAQARGATRRRVKRRAERPARIPQPHIEETRQNGPAVRAEGHIPCYRLQLIPER